MEVTAPGKGADRGAWEEALAILEAEELEDERIARLLELAARSKAARRGVAAALVGTEVLLKIAGSVDEPVGADAKAAERVLRRAAKRDVEAQRRTNPIRINEGFACGHCGHQVPPASGGGVRNHCPRCLRSQHVDGAVPGDRAAACDGLMDPVSWSTAGGVSSVCQRCRRCGHTRRNRLRFDWPDDPDQDLELLRLGRGAG